MTATVSARSSTPMTADVTLVRQADHRRPGGVAHVPEHPVAPVAEGPGHDHAGHVGARGAPALPASRRRGRPRRRPRGPAGSRRLLRLQSRSMPSIWMLSRSPTTSTSGHVDSSTVESWPAGPATAAGRPREADQQREPCWSCLRVAIATSETTPQSGPGAGAARPATAARPTPPRAARPRPPKAPASGGSHGRRSGRSRRSPGRSPATSHARRSARPGPRRRRCRRA